MVAVPPRPSFTYPGVTVEDVMAGTFLLRPLPVALILPGATQGDDTMLGGVGNDDINALGGDDVIFGGKGDDWIRGSTGNDLLYGGNNDDVINAGSGDDSAFGGAGSDQINGGLGNDVLNGNAGQDLLRGEAGNDRLTGGSGDDFLYGGTGDDQLFGGSGNDLIVGGDGNDRLSGGGGGDVLDGGAGNDFFVFRETDGGYSSFDGGDGFDTLRVLLSDPFGVALADAVAYLDAIFDAGPDGDGFFHIDGLGHVKDIERITAAGLNGGDLIYMV